MRIGLIPGHTKTAGGAVNYKGENEYNWASRILKLAQPLLKCESVFVTRDNIGIEGAVKHCVDKGCLATLELHFNWAASDPEKDIEVLCSSKRPRSVNWAKRIAKDLNDNYDSFGVRNSQGAYIDPPRGGNNVLQGHVNNIDYCVLVEPQFGNLDNSDARQIFEDDIKLAKVLANSINSFFQEEGLLLKEHEMPPSNPHLWNPEVFFRKMDELLVNPSEEKLSDMKIIWPRAKQKINNLLKE